LEQPVEKPQSAKALGNPTAHGMFHPPTIAGIPLTYRCRNR
jgi:hypothetical protein